jgi:FkbM family methyltransferase
VNTHPGLVAATSNPPNPPNPPSRPRRWREALRRGLRRAGIELSRFPAPGSALYRRGALLRHYGIELVIDVGASQGQYGLELRQALGWPGRIVSFEPLAPAFEALAAAAALAPPWQALALALGEQEGEARLQVAGNSESSSLRPMLPRHLVAAPHSARVGEQTVHVAPLDALWPTLRQGATRSWLKLDTQGFERQVLEGARQALADIDTVQLELSLQPLYEGAAGFAELHAWLSERGYRLVGIEPGFGDPASGELLQMDGIYHRPFSR